jgi:hypothetical protein
MSTKCQWREALLYNYGAISLPEGEMRLQNLIVCGTSQYVVTEGKHPTHV